MWIKINNNRINFNHIQTYNPTSIIEMNDTVYAFIINKVAGGSITFRFENKQSRDECLRNIDKKLKI